MDLSQSMMHSLSLIFLYHVFSRKLKKWLETSSQKMYRKKLVVKCNEEKNHTKHQVNYTFTLQEVMESFTLPDKLRTELMNIFLSLIVHANILSNGKQWQYP